MSAANEDPSMRYSGPIAWMVRSSPAVDSFPAVDPRVDSERRQSLGKACGENTVVMGIAEEDSDHGAEALDTATLKP